MTDDADDASPGQDADPEQHESVQRLLVVAAETVRGKALFEKILDQAEHHDHPTEVCVVAPAMTHTRFEHHAGDIDDAQREAYDRMQETCEAIREAGIEVGGFVGDSDPALAIADALATFDADRVIISTHPEGRSLWLEDGVVERAREEHELPIDHVVVDLEGETDADDDLAEVDRDERPPDEIATEEEAGDTDIDSTQFMSRATPLEIAGIATGAVSTVVLAALAISCHSDSQTIDVLCGLRYLLGIGIALVTFWHAIALMMMRSVKYQGFWEDALAKGLLFGGPAAVVLSVLIGLFD